MKDLADFIVKYASKLGASYSEARTELTKGSSFMLKNGVPAISCIDKVKGIGIRLIVNNNLGFVSTNELKKEKIKKLVERTIKNIKGVGKLGEKIKLAPDKINKAKYSVKQKIKIEDLDAEEKLRVLFDAEKNINKLGIKVPGRYLSYGDCLTNEYLVNSEGTQIDAVMPAVNFFYFLTIQQNNETSQRYWQYGNRGGFEFVKKWDIPNLLVSEVKAVHKNMKNGIRCPKGKLDVVAGPQVIGIMAHESVGHPYEADRILGREGAQAGESFITQKMIGNQIGSKIVNVVDDPGVENAFGFYQYDNEGVKAKRKYLIRNGKINEFLHNRETAAKMSLSSNGSSRATDYDKESIVRMSNTFLLPGDYKEEELIESVKKGIYMVNFMEWNIDDKRWNQKYVGSEAYLIENGKITNPVKRPIIEITTPEIWKSISKIGKKIELHAATCGKGEPMQGIPVTMGGPSALLRGLRIK